MKKVSIQIPDVFAILLPFFKDDVTILEVCLSFLEDVATEEENEEKFQDANFATSLEQNLEETENEPLADENVQFLENDDSIQALCIELEEILLTYFQ